MGETTGGRACGKALAMAGVWTLCCALAPLAGYSQESPDPRPPAASAAAEKDLGGDSDQAAPPADSSPSALELADPDEPVEFKSQVRPILETHCLECHNHTMHAGGLNLDAREGALRGGDSGRKILETELEGNELHARVTSADQAYRMPKNSPPLSPAEIAILTAWARQGASWPIPPPAVVPPIYERWTEGVTHWFDEHRREYQYALPVIVLFLLLLIVMLLVLRARAAYRRAAPWSRGRLAAFCRFSDRIRTREVLLVFLLAAGGVVGAAVWGHIVELNKKLAITTKAFNQHTSQWAHTPYGHPPRPIRDVRDPKISVVYYRGNCERNENLFNGGNYLTATFRISLCDGQKKPLEVGDPIPQDGLFVRCEIERAVGTTETLYTDEMMSSVYFTRQFIEDNDGEFKEPPVLLEILKPNWRWAAYIPAEQIAPVDKTEPLNKTDSDDYWAGVIYLYTGQIKAGRGRGTPQYGIQYDLHSEDGKIAAGSDLWMDSFGNAAFQPHTPAKELPYQEWFSEQTMPFIEGENTRDPALLGIDEHIKNGLISPSAETRKSAEPAALPEPAAGAKAAPAAEESQAASKSED